MSSFGQAVSMSSRVLHSKEEFKLISSEWRELFWRCPDATPFQNPDWLRCWMDAFAPRDLAGIEIREGERMIGLAPLLIYERGTQRVLAFAGGGVSDYLGLLAEPGREEHVLDEALRVAEEIAGWSTLDLTDIAGTSGLLRYEPFVQFSREHDVCFVLSLPETRELLLRTFSNRQRANLRNAWSRTRREGSARIELAQADTVSGFLDDLFRLHELRWKEVGEAGVLHDERVRQFHRALAPRLLADGGLHLYRMWVNERTAAVIYSVFHGGTVFCYLQGFDPAFSHLSPGTQLMFAVLEDAVRLGMRRFDFLRGGEAYKMHWRPQKEPTFRIEVSKSRLATQLPQRAA
jgi:CelD/BcsL family acetyltransferase involved in cellulose biosynthesis